MWDYSQNSNHTSMVLPSHFETNGGDSSIHFCKISLRNSDVFVFLIVPTALDHFTEMLLVLTKLEHGYLYLSCDKYQSIFQFSWGYIILEYFLFNSLKNGGKLRALTTRFIDDGVTFKLLFVSTMLFYMILFFTIYFKPNLLKSSKPN